MGVTMSEPMTDKATVRVKDNRFTVGASSMQGWRMSMEDAHTLHLALPGDESAAFFAVYDGHGGSKVSMYASENLHRHIVDNDHYSRGDYVKALEEGFLSMDRELFEVYSSGAKLAGSTAICLLIVKNKIYCANVGDSRAVASIDARCVPLSLDHKPDNDIEYCRIAAAGGYIEANRVNGNLALSRALGDFHYKGNELLPAQDQIVSPFPDIKMAELNDDVDFLVLACDGIWDVLTNEEVVDFVASRLEEEMEPGMICEQLMSRCLAPDCDLVVGCDNMTVVLICHTRGLGFPVYCENIWNKYSGKINRNDHYGQGYTDQSSEDYQETIPQESVVEVAIQPSDSKRLQCNEEAHSIDTKAQNQSNDVIANNSASQLDTTKINESPPSSAATEENEKSEPNKSAQLFQSKDNKETKENVDDDIEKNVLVNNNKESCSRENAHNISHSQPGRALNPKESSLDKNIDEIVSPTNDPAVLKDIDKLRSIDENSNQKISATSTSTINEN